MSDISSRMSVVDSLPAVIPPTTRFNFIKNWWHRSNETASVAEARIIKRIYGALPLTTNLPLSAHIGRVPIDKKNDTKQVNTLYISQKQSSTNFEFQHDVQGDELLKIMKEETNAETKNLVMCHGYGAGLGFFYR
jgi:cardiolipin-specific phospholipase